ncbi:MAG: diguanylate cyclase [Actinobacteria bacterium]|nr:MAG: diguanylate cyclase [Actinomycetota bacterium]
MENKLTSIIKNIDFCGGLLNNLNDGLQLVDKNKKIIFWNKKARKITGYNESDVINKSCSDGILIHVDSKGTPLCNNSCPISAVFNDGRSREVNAYYKHKDGYRVPSLIKISPVGDIKDGILGCTVLFNDNSEIIKAQQIIKDLKKETLIDHLTGLPNRRFIENRLFSALDEMKRYNRTFGVLFIDIDHFKSINDNFGHRVGDKVLKMVAMVLLKNIRSFDTVGRWGGEEFIVIVLNVNKKRLMKIANKLRILVQSSNFPLRRKNSIIRVTISIGAVISQPIDTVKSLIQRADKLMYNSKISGRNKVSIEEVALSRIIKLKKKN